MSNKNTRFVSTTCLLLIVFANLATLHAQSAERYNVAALRNVMVAARDGVKLATDVYLPARNSVIVNGRFPAIVERTPYNKNDVSPTLIEYFVTRGYAVVTQDVRGRFRSEGRWRPIKDDGADGAHFVADCANEFRRPVACKKGEYR